MRVTRKRNPARTYYNYRRHFPDLLEDFEGRCAYSMQHWTRAGGKTAMEIDHFNPHLATSIRNAYTNLYLSTRHCNGAKSDTWPSKALQAQGIRFLDPCREMDYGVHIFEDPDTGKLWGATPAGRYHIRCLGLNAEHFMHERIARRRLRQLISSRSHIFSVKESYAGALDTVRAVLETANLMIPDIPLKKDPKSGSGKRV